MNLLHQAVYKKKTKMVPHKKIKLSTLGNRNYSVDFIKFGFRSCETNEIIQPQRVVCGKMLANESLKPFKLKRHLEHLNI